MRMKIAVLVAVFVALGSMAAQLKSDKSAETPDLGIKHQASFTEAFLAGSVLPTFDNGYLISRGTMGAPQIALYDRDGRRAQSVTLTFSDASRVHIAGVGVSSNGEIITAGYASNAENEIAYFIAKANPGSGELSKVIRVNPFTPKQVCEDFNGNVWALGEELRTDPRTFDVLRQYSFDRGLLRTFLPRKTFATSLSRGGSYLRCSASAVGLFTGAEWITVNVKNLDMKRFTIDKSSIGSLTITGFALTEVGAFGSFADRAEGTDFRGLAKLKCDEHLLTCRWISIKETVHGLDPNDTHPKEFPNLLLGADKDDLVYTVGRGKLEWARAH